jgi:hypothetical protein
VITVMETFQLFKLEYPEIRTGKPKFTSLRPPHVLPVSEKDHTVCCYIYHEIFGMLVAGLKKLHATLPSAHHIVSESVYTWSINCCFGNCDECSSIERFVCILLTEDHPDDTLCDYCKWEPNNTEKLVHTT